MESNLGEVAAVIVEPIAGNMGVVLPADGFLEGFGMTHEHGCLLIFDEVISGFRVAFGGAQSSLGVMPILHVSEKKLVAGFRWGLRCNAEIMSEVAPLGSMYQAGTLSGNPVAMAAGIATLDELARPEFTKICKIPPTNLPMESLMYSLKRGFQWN
ncbi:MAG: hypothetical protein Ct9H300mP19_12480 [Dehalococcoidia bacterium]|nr:MAG: hypothetical protein Ct9H300mP19_12480 [Dehalococcoidia bacterium]